MRVVAHKSPASSVVGKGRLMGHSTHRQTHPLAIDNLLGLKLKK